MSERQEDTLDAVLSLFAALAIIALGGTIGYIAALVRGATVPLG